MTEVEVGRTDYAVPTGDFIREWLDENGISQAQLAERMGVSGKHVSLLINGLAPLSHDMSLRLERVTGIPARIWNNQESLYQEDRARLRATSALIKHVDQISLFPVEALRRRGWISAPNSAPEAVLDQILRFFGVADFSAWDKVWGSPQAAYRQSRAYTASRSALATWLRLGELQAESLTVVDFSQSRLRALLPEIRSLTVESVDKFQPKLVELAGSAGVAVVFVPDIPGTRCFGATRWVRSRPIVQLSLRGKKNDQFWFTLFHELGHVILHPQSQVFIDGENLDEDQVEDDPAEKEADAFASDLLIPSSTLYRLPRTRNIAAVKEFAAAIGVAPGIVIGRIHRETGDYGWGHGLKVTLKFADDAV